MTIHRTVSPASYFRLTKWYCLSAASRSSEVPFRHQPGQSGGYHPYPARPRPCIEGCRSRVHCPDSPVLGETRKSGAFVPVYGISNDGGNSTISSRSFESRVVQDPCGYESIVPTCVQVVAFGMEATSTVDCQQSVPMHVNCPTRLYF
jgi:hypothetical protein